MKEVIQDKVEHYKNHWRDVLVVLTAILVLGSLVLVAYGIKQNNQLAAESKQHIDCILKASATKPPPGTPANSRKYIIGALSNECKVKFTQ